MRLYYSSEHMAWGCDMINSIIGLKYRLNVCSMSISSKYGFQTRWKICVMACTAIMKFCFLASPTCQVVRCVKPEHVLGQNTSWSFHFPQVAAKDHATEKQSFLLFVLMVLHYGQALQNCFCPLNATNICQFSGWACDADNKINSPGSLMFLH